MRLTAPPGIDGAPAPTEHAVAPRERVLIIDDEEGLRSTLADFISMSGYAVETAGDGDHALELLARGSYDLVLCDLKMPAVDGSVVIECARATHPETAVIVMTGHATIDNAVHALRTGAYDFLRKPFTLEEIERTIENCLEKRRLRRRNAELTKRNARLREIERIKDDLLSTVSHEFRTPLTAVSGFLAMIDTQGVDNLRDDQIEALDAVRANVDRLDAMIANLLTLTESKDGGYRAVREPVRAGEFLDEFFRHCNVIEHRGDFHAEVDGEADDALLSLDRARFPLVLSNLIDNAFKFAPGPGLGRVLLRARRAGDRFHLEVHDDGVGIPPSIGDRVFDRFTQADMSSTREFPGAGLGLAVVSEVVRAHGGTVKLGTPELGGTSIHVTLPVARIVTDSLNQADVDALLGAIAPELPAPTELESRSVPRRSADAYNFSHPDLLSREQIRSVRTLHEGYAQALAKRLSTELLTNVSASVSAVDQLTYGEFLMLLPTPALLSVIEVSELDGNVAIEIDPAFSFAFIDRLLGGVGDPLEAVRPLTAIEQGLMDGVLQRCCRELEITWAPLTSLQFRLQSIETNPELARVVGSSEMVVLLTLQLRMNDVSGTMHLCLPYVVMEPALHRMARGTRYPRTTGGPPERARSALAGSLHASRIAVSVELGTAELTLREMLALAPGDVLRMRPAAESGAEAKIEGVPCLRGAPGRSRGRIAFEVQEAHPRGRREEDDDAGG